MRTETSDLQTDQMSIAHSLGETGVSIPLLTSLSISAFTFSLIEYGTGRDLMNFDSLSDFTCNFALYPVSLPISHSTHSYYHVHLFLQTAH